MTDYHADIVAMSRDTPLGDGYLLSLWANYFGLPTARAVERKHGLTRDDVNVLFALSARGTLTAARICVLNGRPKNSISRSVNKLLLLGMISRRVDETDKRCALLKLTAVGREAFDDIADLFKDRQDFMLGALDQAERKRLQALLLKSMQPPYDWTGEC